MKSFLVCLAFPFQGRTLTATVDVACDDSDTSAMAYSVERVERAGRNLTDAEITSELLGALETALDTAPLEALSAPRFDVSETYAFDLMLGQSVPFRIHAVQGRVVGVSYVETGYGVPASSEQFTEAAEAWHLDRDYEAMLDAQDLAYAKF